MQERYARSYRELYDRHWWWRARESLLMGILPDYRPRTRSAAILDVGCGDGLFFDKLSAFGHVEGVEPDGRIVGERYRERIHICSFDAHFQPGKEYSLILMLDVLEHLPDPVGAVANARRLLAPGGSLIVTVPAFLSLWTSHDEINHHRTRFTKTSLRAVTAAAGIEAVMLRYFFHWLFPAKLVVRFSEGFMGSVGREPRIPPSWLNQTLYAFSRMDGLITRALPLPFGSSLLLIGR